MTVLSLSPKLTSSGVAAIILRGRDKCNTENVTQKTSGQRRRMRSGVLTSIGSRQRRAISGRQLRLHLVNMAQKVCTLYYIETLCWVAKTVWKQIPGRPKNVSGSIVLPDRHDKLLYTNDWRCWSSTSAVYQSAGVNRCGLNSFVVGFYRAMH